MRDGYVYGCVHEDGRRSLITYLCQQIAKSFESSMPCHFPLHIITRLQYLLLFMSAFFTLQLCTVCRLPEGVLLVELKSTNKTGNGERERE